MSPILLRSWNEYLSHNTASPQTCSLGHLMFLTGVSLTKAGLAAHVCFAKLNFIPGMETPLEHILTHAYKEQMMAYIAEHPEDFGELIGLAVSEKQPYNWRGTWLLCSTMADNDPRVRHRLDEIIRCIPARQPSHQRELMRVLLKMDLDDEQEGTVFDLAVSNWERLGLKPAVRYIAFRMIMKIAQKYPELHQEIHQLTGEHYLEPLSPGVRHSIGKIVKGLSV